MQNKLTGNLSVHNWGESEGWEYSFLGEKRNLYLHGLEGNSEVAVNRTKRTCERYISEKSCHCP